MDIVEGLWVLINLAIILIVLLVDPKNTASSIGSASILTGFESARSRQNFIYKFSAIIIVSFYILTIKLSLN